MEREGAGRQQQLWHSGAMAGGEEFTGVCKSDDLVNDFQQEKHKKEETNANTPKRLIPEMRSRDEPCRAEINFLHGSVRVSDQTRAREKEGDGLATSQEHCEARPRLESVGTAASWKLHYGGRNCRQSEIC